MQRLARFDAVELSGKVGVTPASDSRHTTGSHLGRAFAGAYCGDGECTGGLGVEVGALAWPAVSSGALQRWRCSGAATAATLASGGGRREERATERVEWPGGAGRRPDQVKAGRPRRVQRRRTAATWPAPCGARRAPRAGERGEGKRAALPGWAEREAGRPSSACPLSLFLNLFCQILSKFIWTI